MTGGNEVVFLVHCVRNVKGRIPLVCSLNLSESVILIVINKKLN